MEEFVCSDGRMSVNGVCYISNTPNQGNDNNTILPPPPSSNNKFEWSFDKVGDTVGNFNDILTGNLTSFNSYVSEKLGVENIAKTAATGLALGPMTVPYMIGKGIFNQYQKNQNNTITDKTMKDPQGDIVTYDMMTYNNPNITTNDTNTETNNQITGGEASYTNTASTGAKDGFGYGL